MLLWTKALHLIFMVTWFAGLFYLPRLFVYHANATDTISLERFQVMERKLFYAIMTPGGLLTVGFGIWTAYLTPYQILQEFWFLAKMGCIVALICYHIYCGRLLYKFQHKQNHHSHIWYRWFNEIPALFLFFIIFLAVLQPT